jgi:hypothetical protein
MVPGTTLAVLLAGAFTSPAAAADVDLLSAAHVELRGGPAELAGGPLAPAGDVNGDGRADVIVGAPSASANDKTQSGSAYVVFGRPSWAPMDLTAIGTGGFRIDGAAYDAAGTSVAAAGDVNGDGRDDVIVGAPGSNRNGRRDAGAAFVVFGKASTTGVRLSALGKLGFRIDGATAQDFTGSAVAGLGDVDGDGFDDVAAGSPGLDAPGRAQAGGVQVVLGSASTAPVDLAAPGSRASLLTGSAAGEWVGGALSSGDVDGDGAPDLIAGVSQASHHGRPQSGSAYVVYGAALGRPIDLAGLGADGLVIDGGEDHGWLGASVAGAGDVDGDGYGDVLAGAPKSAPGGRDFAGSAWLVRGGPAGGVVDLAVSPGRAIRFDGQRGGRTNGGDELGTDVSAAGDVDGDGLADVMIGAPWYEVPGRWAAGAAYLVRGGTPFGSTVAVNDAPAGVTRFLGAAAGDRTGGAVSAAGDLDGDGERDLLIGAPFADRDGRTDAGIVHMIAGRDLLTP